MPEGDDYTPPEDATAGNQSAKRKFNLVTKDVRNHETRLKKAEDDIKELKARDGGGDFASNVETYAFNDDGERVLAKVLVG